MGDPSRSQPQPAWHAPPHSFNRVSKEAAEEMEGNTRRRAGTGCQLDVSRHWPGTSDSLRLCELCASARAISAPTAANRVVCADRPESRTIGRRSLPHDITHAVGTRVFNSQRSSHDGTRYRIHSIPSTLMANEALTPLVPRPGGHAALHVTRKPRGGLGSELQ